jgi:hypothetical protein
MNAGFGRILVYLVKCSIKHAHRQVEIYKIEPLIPEPNPFEVEIAIANMKSYELPDIDQIPAQLVQEGGETLRFVIHKLINSLWKMEELPQQWKESIIILICKKSHKIDCSKY